MIKTIITFEHSEQITEDKFKKINPTAEVDDNTTVGQIKAWYKSIIQLGPMEIKMIELLDLKTKKEEEK